MTLPYPHGVETGDLKERGDTKPDPLDIERTVQNLVAIDDPYIDIAGCRLRAPRGESPAAAATRVRHLMTERLLERRPNADDATWHRFADSLRAALADQTELDESALRQILLLIDGL